MINRFIVFRGRANPALAHLIARELRCQLGCVVAGAQPEFILAATHGRWLRMRLKNWAIQPFARHW